ncbi:hypothetical protein IGL98_003070 [Enterococcus sp. DIV0840]|uniref:FUSC family protein n=1 Tax=Enterococcus TaxID=1350 RepID=UPI0030D072D0
MRFAKIHIEQRTIKMAAVVFMCIAFYSVVGTPDNTSLMMISSSTAAFGIYPKTVDVWIFARYRMLGTAIGCFFGTVYLLIQNHLTDEGLSRLIFIPFLIFITVTISGGVKSPITVRGSVMTLIAMTLVTPVNDKNYVLQRILATLVGTLMAVLVNFLFEPKKSHILKDLRKSIDVDKRKEKDDL